MLPSGRAGNVFEFDWATRRAVRVSPGGPLAVNGC